MFTADDVVTYDFLPEKYAAAQPIVTAELNILIECDWQDAINDWCRDLANVYHTASPNIRDALMKAQEQPWTQSEPATTATQGATNRVGSNDVAMTNAEACQAVQGMVHIIASNCCDGTSFYAGTASSVSYTSGTAVGKSVAVQFKDALGLLLNATSTDSAATNTLNIDQSKVLLDLDLPSPAGTNHAYTMVPVENGSTTKLSELLSGFAFVPIASDKNIDDLDYVSTKIQVFSDGTDHIKVYALPNNFVPWVSGQKYVQVNEVSVVKKEMVNILANEGWHPVKGNSTVAFQLNIIFSKKSTSGGVNAVGSF